MTDPSQYFKGRTVQEQMNEVIGYVDVRSAEVATDAIASDVAQVHQDMLDADADAAAAAASAAAAAGTLANAVKKTGEASQSIAGDIAVVGDLTGGTVTVPTPVNNTDAASKKYVDDQDANDVHLTGNQTVGGVKTFSSSPVVPTETTGTFSTNAANSNKVKNELDNYDPMVRTTGNQTVGGKKTFVSNETDFKGNWPHIRMISDNIDLTDLPSDYNDAGNYSVRDKNGVSFGTLRFVLRQNGTSIMQAVVRNSDGSYKYITLGTGDVI